MPLYIYQIHGKITSWCFTQNERIKWDGPVKHTIEACRLNGGWKCQAGDSLLIRVLGLRWFFFWNP